MSTGGLEPELGSACGRMCFFMFLKRPAGMYTSVLHATGTLDIHFIYIYIINAYIFIVFCFCGTYTFFRVTCAFLCGTSM